MDLERVLTHHWLKLSGDKSFHAFLSIQAGSRSICGVSLVRESIRDVVQIPGERSVCCVSCHRQLYGFPKSVLREKNESRLHS